VKANLRAGILLLWAMAVSWVAAGFAVASAVLAAGLLLPVEVVQQQQQQQRGAEAEVHRAPMGPQNGGLGAKWGSCFKSWRNSGAPPTKPSNMWLLSRQN